MKIFSMTFPQSSGDAGCVDREALAQLARFSPTTPGAEEMKIKFSFSPA
jgi:hypothetical protein